jgi:nicotinamidase-related amidase
MSRALVVIDIQNDYFADGVLPLHGADETSVRIAKTIESARRAGDRIVLVQHISKATSGLFASGGTGVDIRPSILAAAADAPIVIKHVADSFQDTDLASHLEGVDTLLICGMMTQNCVVFTAMSKAAEKFNVIVVEDLCAAPTETVHKIALSALRSKLDVQSSEQVWG